MLVQLTKVLVVAADKPAVESVFGINPDVVIQAEADQWEEGITVLTTDGGNEIRVKGIPSDIIPIINGANDG